MLFELLPYPMDIVITFLKPSTFYITSTSRRRINDLSRAHLAKWAERGCGVYGNYTIEVQKKITLAGNFLSSCHINNDVNLN